MTWVLRAGRESYAGRIPKLNNSWGGIRCSKTSKGKSSVATLCLYASYCQGVHQRQAVTSRYLKPSKVLAKGFSPPGLKPSPHLNLIISSL